MTYGPYDDNLKTKRKTNFFFFVRKRLVALLELIPKVQPVARFSLERRTFNSICFDLHYYA